MADKGEVAPLELWPLFEIIVGTARIIGSAVLNPPGRDASGRAEKRMTAAWLVAWAGFNRRKWIGVHQEYGLGFTKMAIDSLIERQCRGSTHKGEMLVGQHGEETAVWIGWDSLEENGTIIVDDKEEFWLLQVMTISEVDSGRKEDCFGFKKNLGPLHMGKSFGVSNFRRLEQDEENGKRLAKVRSKLEALVSPKKWVFGYFYRNWVGPNKCISLGFFKESWF